MWVKELRVRGLYAKDLRGEELEVLCVGERMHTMCATTSSVTKVCVKELCMSWCALTCGLKRDELTPWDLVTGTRRFTMNHVAEQTAQTVTVCNQCESSISSGALLGVGLLCLVIAGGVILFFVLPSEKIEKGETGYTPKKGQKGVFGTSGKVLSVTS